MKASLLMAGAIALVVAALSACEQAAGKVDDEAEQGPEIKQVTITMRASDFRRSGIEFALAAYDVPELTAEIVNNGTVTAHYQFSDGDIWNGMPFSLITEFGQSEISYSYWEGSLGLRIDGETVTSGIVNLYDRNKVRLTLIPPGRLAP